MKISATAGELAGALALAASLSNAGRIRHLVGLGAVRLTTADDRLTIAADVLDYAVALDVPAVVEVPGEVAVAASSLAALTAGFLPGTTIEIQSDGTVCRVVGGRSRFKLPTIPLEDLPVLKFDEETGRVELVRAEASTLLMRPAFATSDEGTRYYLCGVCLHDDHEGLTAAATDGHRLVRTRVPGVTGLSSDLTLIVPSAAIKIVAKLLADKSVERVVLRRSRTLLALETTKAVFTSKLIDGVFPDYSRILPGPSGNHVIAERAGLKRALDRVAAMIDPTVKAMRLAGLQWAPDDQALRLCVPGHDLADDIIDAETVGAGRFAVQIHHLCELFDELPGKRIRLDTSGTGISILVTDPDDPQVLAVQMPCSWRGEP